VTLLLALLIAAMALALLAGDASARATALVLLGNWCINTAFVSACADPDAWAAFLVVDYLSALLLIAFYQTTVVRLVCVAYALQCVAHGAYGYVTMSDVNPLATYIYWWLLYCLAMAQIAIVGGMVAYQCVGDWSGAGGSVSFGKSGLHQGKSEGSSR